MNCCDNNGPLIYKDMAGAVAEIDRLQSLTPGASESQSSDSAQAAR
jgi:hypothetical protein